MSARKKRWELRPPAPPDFLKAMRGRPPLIATLLYQRELRDAGAIDAFLSPDYKSGFHDPFLLKGMDVAARRVAHAIAEDPADLYDANIFYPHRNTLAYSEANIVPGLLGVPAYLITRSPYATHNSVVLMGFIFSFLTAYALAHYLTRHTAASILCGIAFAYCPFIFARTAHIQLLMNLKAETYIDVE